MSEQRKIDIKVEDLEIGDAVFYYPPNSEARKTYGTIVDIVDGKYFRLDCLGRRPWITADRIVPNSGHRWTNQ